MSQGSRLSSVLPGMQSPKFTGLCMQQRSHLQTYFSSQAATPSALCRGHPDDEDEMEVRLWDWNSDHCSCSLCTAVEVQPEESANLSSVSMARGWMMKSWLPQLKLRRCLVSL